MWREDDEDSRANLAIEDMALDPDDAALFDMFRDEAVPPPLATQNPAPAARSSRRRSFAADHADLRGRLITGPFIGGRRPISWRLTDLTAARP